MDSIYKTAITCQSSACVQAQPRSPLPHQTTEPNSLSSLSRTVPPFEVWHQPNQKRRAVAVFCLPFDLRPPVSTSICRLSLSVKCLSPSLSLSHFSAIPFPVGHPHRPPSVSVGLCCTVLPGSDPDTKPQNPLRRAPLPAVQEDRPHTVCLCLCRCPCLLFCPCAAVCYQAVTGILFLRCLLLSVRLFPLSLYPLFVPSPEPPPQWMPPQASRQQPGSTTQLLLTASPDQSRNEFFDILLCKVSRVNCRFLPLYLC